MKIAVLITCYNRILKTKKCLLSLVKVLPDCHIYLVDDQSTDGTSEMIRNEFPEVHIIQGNGNLFWSRGMYRAWTKAIKGKYDYYLWLNDDVELYPNFYQELIECQQLNNNHCIVSGIVENAIDHEIIYGGYDKNKNIIFPSYNPQNITFLNGNVVLIPQSVVSQIGIIDPKYHHDLGDVDYGLRAIKKGIKVITTRIPIAKGEKNNVCRVRKWGTTLINRFKNLYSPLGANPNTIFYFRKKHYGIIHAIIYVTHLLLINIISDKMIELIYRGKYNNQ